MCSHGAPAAAKLNHQYSEWRAEVSAWQAEWEPALAAWSRFTQLSPPRFCTTRSEERDQGLETSFAMIRLNDQAVVISLRQVAHAMQLSTGAVKYHLHAARQTLRGVLEAQS